MAFPPPHPRILILLFFSRNLCSGGHQRGHHRFGSPSKPQAEEITLCHQPRSLKRARSTRPPICKRLDPEVTQCEQPFPRDCDITGCLQWWKTCGLADYKAYSERSPGRNVRRGFATLGRICGALESSVHPQGCA